MLTAMIGIFMYDPTSPLLRPASGASAQAPQAKARFAEDRLLDAVLWCEVAPGETVTEADVMDRFALTRAAARSGLTRLGYDGWATPQPRTGWQVLPVTGALIGQVLEARRLAEPALTQITLTHDTRSELLVIEAALAPLLGRQEEGAQSAVRQYIDRVEGALLGALDPFTARHLRKLWHHTARITRFFERSTAGRVFRRSDIRELLHAVLAGDGESMTACRLALIDAQQSFFLENLLQNDAPLTPGSGMTGQPDNAATHRRET